MNGILGMLQLLETSLQDKEELEFCALAIQSANRLTTLLSDILDLSRVEARMMFIRSIRFNLHSALAQAVDLFEPVAVQTGVALTRHLDPGLPTWVVGDPIRLQQVLINLIGNAFKFTKLGHVHIEAYPLLARGNDSVRIFFAIADTGCGIPDEELENLFQPFTHSGKPRIYSEPPGCRIGPDHQQATGGPHGREHGHGKRGGSGDYLCFLRDPRQGSAASWQRGCAG